MLGDNRRRRHKTQEMKEKIKKKYIKRLIAIIKSKLNSGNTV